MGLVSVVKLYSCLGTVSSTMCFFFVLKLDVTVCRIVLKYAGYSARRCFKKPNDLINDSIIFRLNEILATYIMWQQDLAFLVDVKAPKWVLHIKLQRRENSIASFYGNRRAFQIKFQVCKTQQWKSCTFLVYIYICVGFVVGLVTIQNFMLEWPCIFEK
jgi:hypothetical protein